MTFTYRELIKMSAVELHMLRRLTFKAHKRRLEALPFADASFDTDGIAENMRRLIDNIDDALLEDALPA